MQMLLTLEFKMPFGFKEVEGVTKNQLRPSQHEFSGKSILGPTNQRKLCTFYVIETSIGVDRMSFNHVSQLIQEETLENGETSL